MNSQTKDSSQSAAMACSASLTPRVDAELVDHMPEPHEWTQLYLDLATLARTLENESEFFRSALAMQSDSDSNPSRVKELCDALERIVHIESRDEGDPWSALESIGAIAHNALCHPAPNSSDRPPEGLA